jgi:hypothetical protein
MMTRQQTRRAFLFAIGMALGKLDVLKASGGELIVDLGQWDHVVFKYRGKNCVVPVAEVFAAVQEGHGHTTT